MPLYVREDVMPIRLVLETLDGNDIVQDCCVLPENGCLMADYVKGAQNILYILSNRNDFGGTIYREPGVVEDSDGNFIASKEDFEGKKPPNDDKIIADLPVAGVVTFEITNYQGFRLKLHLTHFGKIALLCHPNTRSPLPLFEIMDGEDEAL